MDVLMLSPAPFRSFRRSKQFLALALARLGHGVSYVDPPVSPLSVVRHPERRTELTGRSRYNVEGVEVWTPRVVPGQDTLIGQAVNGRLIRRGVRRFATRPDVTVAFSLQSRSVFGHCGGVRIYFKTDSLDASAGADGARLRRFEDELIARADVVIACSRGLVADLAARGVRAHYLPHGADPAYFVSEPPPLPRELVGRSRPFVGYVGSLNGRIDAALLEAARDATDGGTLVVVGGRFAGEGGGITDATRALLDRGDVVVTGNKPAQDVPAYVASLDVGLVPYVEDDFNRNSFPLKVPEYLAAGVPVVSTRNGAVDELGGAVRCASTVESFRSAVRAAIADTSTAARASRIAVAASRPWERNAEELLGIAASVRANPTSD